MYKRMHDIVQHHCTIRAGSIKLKKTPLCYPRVVLNFLLYLLFLKLPLLICSILGPIRLRTKQVYRFGFTLQLQRTEYCYIVILREPFCLVMVVDLYDFGIGMFGNFCKSYGLTGGTI